MNSATKRSIIVFAQLSAVLILSTHILLAAAAKPAAPASGKITLHDHWTLQTSAKVEAKGETISTPTFIPKGWHDVTVPTTVVAALVQDKTLPDPFFATNLRQFPGVTYPVGGNFSNIAMQTDSPYAVSWWYRKPFAVPAACAGKTVWLNFKGINYRANIFLNGKQIANSDSIVGAWRTYELNVTDSIKPGRENVLAVQVFAPTENDLAITFVDWNPAPPDKNMGLWREVYLTTSGPVALRYPTVVSKLNPPANDSAQLTVTAQLKNGTDQPMKGVSIRSPSSSQLNSPLTKTKTLLSPQTNSLNSSSRILACGGRRKWVSLNCTGCAWRSTSPSSERENFMALPCQSRQNLNSASAKSLPKSMPPAVALSTSTAKTSSSAVAAGLPT
jgi:hypothetical protein